MKFKRKILSNGMRVILVPMSDMPTVTVLVMVEAGSKYETKNISGLSHFLEHMCFKGTAKRPTALDLSRELDGIGSHYNAFTSEEFTGYYAKAASKHADKLLDVVSDLYLNPVFPEKEIEKEKGVIVEEINMYKDLPHRHVQELFMSLVYGDQPVGWGIAGSPETVRNMSRKEFIDYRDKHYVAEATTVIVAGSFDEKKIIASIKEKFASIPRAKKGKKAKVKDVQAEPAVLIEKRPTDQAHIILGVRAFPITSDKTPVLKVLNGILGAGMSSRLFQRLREEMGVGYYVRSSYDPYTDHGLFTVSIGSDTKRVPEVIRAILEELKKTSTELVSHEELEKTKEYLIGTMFLGLESSDAVAEFYGYQEVLNRPLRTPEAIVKEIRAVTPEAVRAVARKIFTGKHLNLAIVGPVSDEASLKALLAL